MICPLSAILESIMSNHMVGAVAISSAGVRYPAKKPNTTPADAETQKKDLRLYVVLMFDCYSGSLHFRTCACNFIRLYDATTT
jgi:hypothetical protein